MFWSREESERAYEAALSQELRKRLQELKDGKTPDEFVPAETVVRQKQTYVPPTIVKRSFTTSSDRAFLKDCGIAAD